MQMRLQVNSSADDGSRLFGMFGAMHRRPSYPTASRRARVGAGLLSGATLLCGVSAADENLPRGSAQFFDQYCGECHLEDQSGGLDLGVVTFDPANRDNFATWVRMLDRVTAGEMPPKKKPRPAPADLAAFSDVVSTSVQAPAIAVIRFSGPRDGEFLAADEIRIRTPDAK
jgi:mono/diheme cytochrome c family protein